MRPPSPRDARVFSLVLNDWRVVANTGTWPYPLTKERAAFRLRYAQGMKPLEDHVFALFHGGAFIGTCGIHRERGPVYSIGYMLGVDYWGKGFATEALRAVCDFGWRICRAERIAGDAFISNPASCRVMQKVGMGFVRSEPGWSAARGAYLPMNRYEMTRTEFRP
ncbi:GNAT family N-acetyltransferase [Parvularcula mediterranea]|nr:GNAT family N-acetyltransferase [Parvularcula mediterranea]